MSSYTVVEIGDMNAWADHSGVVPGKRFLEGEVEAEYIGASANSLAPGGETPFWHTHSQAEEVYIFLGGTGQFALDDEVIDLRAGTVVRVATGVWRAWRAMPDSPEPLTFVCVRAGGDTLEGMGREGELDHERPFPWAE